MSNSDPQTAAETPPACGGVKSGDGTGEHLGDDWSCKASSNVATWGEQRADTLLLALIEEVGEIAAALQESNTIASDPDVDQLDDAQSFGRSIIDEMADLGMRTQTFLESEYPEPTSERERASEHAIYELPENREPIASEVGDAAALLFQLRWALEREEGAV